MATIRVDVVGDSTSLKRALAEAGGASDKVGGQFSHLAKTMLGLGAAFVGASGIIEGFEKSVEAAEALNVATRQLDAQLKTNGESVKAVAPYVEQLNAKFEKLGFTSADTEAAFTRLDRASGSAAIAYKEMGLAADLAAAKHISFSQAALLIGKVIDGTTSALNRYGIAIPKGTSAVDALAIAHQKLAGQAAAAATPMKVFSATVTDLEAKIGEQLLPVIDKYLSKIDAWLSKSENQKKVTDAVAQAVKIFTETVSATAEVVKALIGPTEAVVSALGGMKQVIKDLIVLKLALTLTGWAQSFVSVGTSAEGAKGKVSGLSGMLKALPTAVAITVGLNIIENAHTTKSGLHRYSGSAGWGNLGNDLAGIVGLDWQGKSSSITGGGAALSGLTSGNAMKTFIAQQAIKLGLDPKAVLGVATAEGGFNGAIGDGGHAFGPFQLNNAGGVLTGYQGNPQQYANSSQGIMYALKQMAAVAKGLKGMAAISAIVSKFERPADSTHDLQTAGSYYFGGTGQSMADIQNGPPGSMTLPNMKAAAKAKKASSAAFALDPKLLNAISHYADAAKNAAGAAAVKDLQDEEGALKTAVAKLKAVKNPNAATQKELQAFQNRLNDVQTEIEKAKQKIADDNFIKSLPAKLKSFTSKINADSSKYSALVTKSQYDTGAALDGDFQDITTVLTNQAATLKAERTKLQGMMKGQDATVRAAITAKIKTIGTELQTVASEAASNLQNIAAALAQKVQQAKADFEGALATLQGEALTELQSNLYSQYGVTGDQAQLDAMQQADQQKSLNDALASAQKQLTADLVAGSGATQDTIDADKAAVDQAQRAIDENNLAIRIAQEKNQADQAYTQQSKDLTTKLGAWQTSIENGTGSMDDLNTILGQFGLSAPPNFGAVVSSAKAVATQMLALAQVIAQITGKPVSSGAASGPVVYGNGQLPGDPTGASSGSYTYPGGPGGTIAPGGSNIHTPGHQMAMGGILHAFSGTMVPGVPKASDYVPALLNGGEMILNAGQQMQLWKMIQSGSGFGQGYWSLPKYGGHNQPGASSRGTTVVQNFHIAGTVVAEKELMQLIRTQSARASLRGTTVFGPN